MTLTIPVRSFKEALGRVRSMSPEQLYEFHYGAPLAVYHPPLPEDVPTGNGGRLGERHPNASLTEAGGGESGSCTPVPGAPVDVMPEFARPALDLTEKKR